jgi:hypothetical protein
MEPDKNLKFTLEIKIAHQKTSRFSEINTKTTKELLDRDGFATIISGNVEFFIFNIIISSLFLVNSFFVSFFFHVHEELLLLFLHLAKFNALLCFLVAFFLLYS